MRLYDIIVVGAGPAGLTAACNASHRGLKTLLLEAENTAGGQPMHLYPDKRILDHPGFPHGISGKALSARLYEQALHSGAIIKLHEPVLKLSLKGKIKSVQTGKAVYRSRKVILATGLHNIPKKLPVLKDAPKQKVHYTFRDPKRFKDQKVLIIGGGDTAFERAEMIARYASSVDVAVREDVPKAKHDLVLSAERLGVRVHYRTELLSFIGRQAVLRKGRNRHVINIDHIVVSIGFVTTLRMLEEAGLEKDELGMIKVNDSMETSIPGVFAAGDLTGRVKLIAVACSEGIIAAINTFNSIKEPYWLEDGRLCRSKGHAKRARIKRGSYKLNL